MISGARLARWKGWWKFANIEQLTTLVAITFVTILFTSLLAYSTVFGREDLASDVSFIRTEGEVLGERVGSWFTYFFWFVGAFALFSAALMDPICPPSTAYAAFNAYAGPGEMKLWEFNGHEGGEGFQQLRRLDFLAQTL